MRLPVGLHDRVPASEYHADCCAEPSLSASIAHILLRQSPRHAWAAHPRLGNCAPRAEAEQMDIGTAAHAYVLEGITGFEVLPDEFQSYRTKLAQTMRDSARAAGKVPILASRMRDVTAMAAALTEQLAPMLPFDFPERGRAEETLIWTEGPTYCRARLDWLSASGQRATIVDYKTTEGSAHPEMISRALFDRGWDLKAAWYRRAVKVVLGLEAEFYYIVQEQAAPYAVSVLGLSPAAWAVGEAKLARALATWRVCMAEGVWPGYAVDIAYAEPPAWELAREERAVLLADQGRPIDEELGA